MLHRDVGDVVRSTDTTQVVPSNPGPYPQRGQQRIAIGSTIRLEEAVYEEEEDDEEDDEELIYSDYSDGDPGAYTGATGPDMIAIASRKRDYYQRDQDPSAHAETEKGVARTQPKRTRLEGEYSPLTAAEAAAARTSKRGSEEAALSSVAAGKRPRIYDGEAETDSVLIASGTGDVRLTGGSSTSLQTTGRVGVGGER
jgi:hypothetical protein